MALKTIDSLDLAGKRVFIRVDFNVPLDEQGRVTDDARIRAAIPTIQYAIERRAKVILASHLGRPKGKPEDRKKYTLEPAAARLSELIKQDVILADDGKFVKVFAWYDNEWGFSNRMVDVSLLVAGRL